MIRPQRDSVLVPGIARETLNPEFTPADGQGSGRVYCGFGRVNRFRRDGPLRA